jgi:hypothetical protein
MHKHHNQEFVRFLNAIELAVPAGEMIYAIEGFFSALTLRGLKRCVLRSIVDLQAAINRYIRKHNDDPKPLQWTKSAGAILAKIECMPVPSK